jgi:hypothetical protein
MVIFQCSEEVGISWANVDSCMKSVSGTAMQLLAQQETLKVSPSGLGFVPTITFNKVKKKHCNCMLKIKIRLNYFKFPLRYLNACNLYSSLKV